MTDTLAPPFNRIFSDSAEAEAAFELLRQTALILGIDSPYHPRLAVTLSARTLHLDFGGGLVLGFQSPQKVTLALLNEEAQGLDLQGFKNMAGVEVSNYELPRPLISPMSPELAQVYHHTLNFMAQKFQTWERSAYWKAHKPEVAEAIFDPMKRARLFAEGLPTEELIYERQFTAFNNVAEEEEVYEVNRNITVTPLETSTLLAKPFSDIFIDRAEAEWAFDFLAQTFKLLGINSPDDPRFSLTLPHNKKVLHLNFGNWLVIDFRSPNFSEYRMKLILLADKITTLSDNLTGRSVFVQKNDSLIVQIFGVKVERIEDISPELHDLYQETMIYTAQKFKNWKGTPYRSSHYPQLAEAVFDLNKRKHFLDNGFIDPNMTHEILEPELETNPPYTLDDLMADTYLERATLEQWLRVLERKKQIVLYGPPGTGKTFLAQQLARHLTSASHGHMALVQFHPAYAYEDFMQGLHPHINEAGQLSYVLQPGRFMTFCEQARQSADIHVMIIDEINRANLAQVFGELMYLLEYRDQAIPLAAGGEPFRIPENVYLIGTMNTADRSIALVDHALRRRFAFIHVPPNMAVLRGYQAEKGYNADSLIHVLERLNAAIDDRDHGLGVSFFLVDDLATHLPDIWQLEIEPYLEEYFFNRPDEVAKFRWAEIKKELESAKER